MFIEMIKGTFRFRELLLVVYILPLILFFTTLFSIWRIEMRRLRTINLVAWILAFLALIPLFFLQIHYQVIRLWGLWLFLLLAICALIAEIAIMKTIPNE